MRRVYETDNHPHDLVDYNLFSSNAALVDALEREGAGAGRERLARLGERLGTRAMFELGDAANRNPPVLKAFDRFGARRDEVEFHPAWHELMSALVAEGLHTSAWAEPRPGAQYRITGHKWFFSAPMCDAFLVTAQTEGGVSCFIVPRVLPDGTRNGLYLQRLKDKLGNRSNASSEVEFDDTYGLLVGEEGRGIPRILEMGVYTRFDCATGAAGIMHQCVAQAIHHARHRSAFGKLLADQPLMRNVLADLSVECEAATALALRLARAFDAQRDEAESALRRVLTPVAKYWICKRAPVVGAEAMEVLGGNGYVEEGPIARRFRELPLNGIWEGSGNIMCLDVLRALSREPRTLDALAALLEESRSRDPRFASYVTRLLDELRAGPAEAQARMLVERIALAAQAAILLRGGSPSVAEAFIATRIAASPPAAFGVLPAGLDHGALIARSLSG